jgi:hypothetical protein
MTAIQGPASLHAAATAVNLQLRAVEARNRKLKAESGLLLRFRDM